MGEGPSTLLNVPVTLALAAPGPYLTLSQSGLQFFAGRCDHRAARAIHHDFEFRIGIAFVDGDGFDLVWKLAQRNIRLAQSLPDPRR